MDTTTPISTHEDTSYDGRPALVFDLTKTYPRDQWATACRDFVARAWPDATNAGVGYWTIPNQARIHYSIGTVMFVPLQGLPLPDPADVLAAL